MRPPQKVSLNATLMTLFHEQVEAIRDATYLGWTAESRKAYDDRLKQISEIWERLGTTQGAD